MYSKKKKYFLFSKLQLKHLLFLFFFIISSCKRTAQIFLEKNQKLSIDFLKLYLYDIGDFLSVIPYIIMKKGMESEKISKQTQRVSCAGIKYRYFNDEKNKKNCIGFRKVLIFTIVDFVAQISPVIYYTIKADQKLEVKRANLNTAITFNIIFIMLFSYFILHTEFYRHHLFALLIDIFCFIFLSVFDFIKIYNETESISLMAIIYILIKTINVILYSFENVLGKYLFLYNFISTYALLFYKSIYNFIFLIIFSSPFIFIKMGEENGESKIIFSWIVDIFDNKIYYLIAIGYTLISFFYNNLCQKIIDVFSPNHFAISRVLENFAIFIIDLIINGIDSELYLILRIIVYVLLIFSTLIFNEFLVINICGLGQNTKLFLDYKFERENSLNIEIGESEDLSYTNSRNDTTSSNDEIESSSNNQI